MARRLFTSEDVLGFIDDDDDDEVEGPPECVFPGSNEEFGFTDENEDDLRYFNFTVEDKFHICFCKQIQHNSRTRQLRLC